MAWLEAIWAVTVALIFLLLPGYPAAKLIGAKGLWLHALTPIISIAALILLSVVFGFLDIPWAPWLVLFTAIFVSILIGFILRKSGVVINPDTAASRVYLSTFISWLAFTIVTVILIVNGIKDLENFSQTFDNVFHLNAITYIIDTSKASPFEVNTLTSGGHPSKFYPATWHGLVSLVSQLGGFSVPLAINATNIAILMTVYAPGILLLTRQLGGSRVTEIFAAVIAMSLPNFPFGLLIYGVLYSYYMGVAMLPALIALVFQATGLSAGQRIATRRSLIVLILCVAGAVGATHPSAVMGAVVCAAAPVAVMAFKNFDRIPVKKKIQHLVLFIAYIAAILVASRALNPGENKSGGFSLKNAIRDLVYMGPHSEYKYLTGITLLLTFITLYAGVFIWRRKKNLSTVSFSGNLPLQHLLLLTLAGMIIILMLLYTVAKTVSEYPLKHVTDLWYGDYPRIGALITVLVIPLAAAGATVLIRLLPQVCAPKIRPFIGIAAGLAIIITTIAGAKMSFTLNELRNIYAINSKSVVITSNELALLKRLPDNVPEDAVIAGSPWTGTSLAYTFGHRQVLLPHVFVNDSDPKVQTVRRWLNVSHVYPPACKAAADLNVKYFLDFGSQTIFDYAQISRGLRSGKTGAFELVDREGAAALYKVAECQK